MTEYWANVYPSRRHEGYLIGWKHSTRKAAVMAQMTHARPLYMIHVRLK